MKSWRLRSPRGGRGCGRDEEDRERKRRKRELHVRSDLERIVPADRAFDGF